MAVLLREAREQVPSGREVRRAATASNNDINGKRGELADRLNGWMRMVERDPRGSICRNCEVASATIALESVYLAVRTFVETSFLKSEQ